MAYSLHGPYGKAVMMRSFFALLLLAATPAMAQRDDQVQAYRATREGRIRSLGDILSRIPVDRRRAFIGSEFAPGGDRYRLKFMDRGAVSAVDVDARTGEVVNDRGPRGFEGGRIPAYEDRRGYDNARGRFDEERARAYDDRRDYDDRRGDGDRRERFDDRRADDRRVDDRRAEERRVDDRRVENRRDNRDDGGRRDRGRR